jgi:hypothetical protein
MIPLSLILTVGSGMEWHGMDGGDCDYLADGENYTNVFNGY